MFCLFVYLTPQSAGMPSRCSAARVSMRFPTQYGYPIFTQDLSSARQFLEARRWPGGPVCPFCRLRKAYGNRAKPGFYRCARPSCRSDFTVATGTVMERSHVPLHKWLAALFMEAASWEGCTPTDLQRELGVSYKTAWVLCLRIRDIRRRTRLRIRSPRPKPPVPPARPVGPLVHDVPIRAAISTIRR